MIRTFAAQHKLPLLPVTPLSDVCATYLISLRAVVDDAQFAKSKAIISVRTYPIGSKYLAICRKSDCC
jgi:hypothetical protein